jgi:prophage tail gpP-like protein
MTKGAPWRRANNDVSLVIGAWRIEGWTSVRITRGIERMPSDFEITMTDRFPGDVHEVLMTPGDPLQLFIGNDVVVTGYVDRYVPSMNSSQHLIRVVGRGKCQDLVDCSAEWPGNQISSATALGIAQQLAKPYGINVTLASGVEVGPPIPTFNISVTDSPAEIIERVARYRAFLAYEGPDGNLILSGVGTARAASGFAEGKNVEEMSVVYAADQRFKEYLVYLVSMDTLDDLAGGGNLQAIETDPVVLRRRRKAIVSEAGGGGLDISKKRAVWERNRRAGRSSRLSLTTDSWRDGAGELWTPNTLVDLALPSMRISQATWIIGEVTYELDERGTHARLTMMPPTAFEPEPILLQPTIPDIP